MMVYIDQKIRITTITVVTFMICIALSLGARLSKDRKRPLASRGG
jgi:hypothetical protein